jgi:hypothetical protein
MRAVAYRVLGSVRISSSGAAKESNLPARGLHGPAGFEVRGVAAGSSVARAAECSLVR